MDTYITHSHDAQKKTYKNKVWLCKAINIYIGFIMFLEDDYSVEWERIIFGLVISDGGDSVVISSFIFGQKYLWPLHIIKLHDTAMIQSIGTIINAEYSAIVILKVTVINII